ncbi:IS5 family transposase [Nocardia sp. NPDC005366]|uniref:IS5 family transposase n=1 Tax=Nocardia sp. NPDC005366 TaxID=3156878 RepID=UPI00339EF233
MSLYSYAAAGSDIAEGGCACGMPVRPRHLASVRPRRYTCDSTDAQWAVLAPVLPWPVWLEGGGGRPEKYCRREVIDAIFYLADNGCKWRNLPADFPPRRTVHAAFSRWWVSGEVAAVHNDLRDLVRRAQGRAPDPTAAVIDSQSVRAAETVAAASRGFDAGKKINGRKRHIVVDTIGLLLVVCVTAAGTQDRDGARPALERLRELFATIVLVWPTAPTPASSSRGRTPNSHSRSRLSNAATHQDSWSCPGGGWSSALCRG